jgi:uncharacterized membrane protein
MRTLLADFSSAFATIYTDWILWNLFLAFIPLLLSFFLFRSRAAYQPWLWCATVLVGLIGVIGFWSRTALGVKGWMGVLRHLGSSGEAIPLVAIAIILASLISLVAIWITTGWTRNWLWWLGLGTFIAFLPNAPYLLTDVIHLIRSSRIEVIPTWAIVLGVMPLHLLAIVLGFEAYVISLINLDYFLRRRGYQSWILPAEWLIHALCAVGIYLGRFIRFNSWDLVTEPGNVVVTTLNSLTAKQPLLVISVTFIIVAMLYWICKQITLGLQLRIQQVRLGLDTLE